MPVIANRVKVAVDGTPGTGTIDLGAAVTGFQSFADGGVTNGQVVSYAIEDGDDWEIGTGTYTTGTPNTLSRTVIESSNSDAALDLTNNAVVFITALSGDLQNAVDMDQGVATTDSPSFAGITATTADINGGTIDGTVIGGSTPAAISGTTGTFSGDLTVADKIVHSGDTDTAVRFPAAGTVTVETAGSERIRLDASGNLLVGRTSAASAGAGLWLYDGGGSYGRINYGSSTTSTSFPAIFYNNVGSGVGSISYTTSATSFNTSSDYRLKEDVQPMVGSVDRLMALKPVNFAWKADGSRVDGFLAHEAQEVVPEAVTGEKDAVDDEGSPIHQGIDQSKIVPLLTAALQEALTKIEALEARVAALEGASA